MATRKLAALQDTFFKLYAEARRIGEHAVAYHLLTAALHAAESLEDEQACVRIERLAREHGEWIDANEPQHRLSSASAASRGHESIFRQLVVTANSARLRMQIVPRKQQGRPKAPLRKAKKRRS